MNTVVDSLTTTISNANLWSEIGHAVPIIGVAVLFALGYWVVRKTVKGISHAKAKM